MQTLEYVYEIVIKWKWIQKSIGIIVLEVSGLEYNVAK